MRARIVASAILATAILSGTVGCGLMAPQATTIHYDASDGVSADVGEVSVRNAILISDGEDSANLVFTLVNHGDSSHIVGVQYTSGGDKVTEELTVEANSTLTLGGEAEEPLTLRGIDAQPGSLFPVFVQYGNETGAKLLVPVLDDALGQYSTLVPTPEPTVEFQAPVTATPTPTPTVAP
ncbi:hypothetical protein [Cryobacterium tagatosivorans]|uniref:DNA modification methylase n=1 Tax=Cryobacterium tagatosivorans TaxID=1259199 RepID=A0A4R8UD32_9MICO|nr:hypothetical protein [Cryobacterium tagatosivorans]TFB48876.1 hypothetical protein E3O23_12470 [Cryobacterium tagatosivorans]